MITPEKWTMDLNAGRETREFFSSEAGQLLLQVLYRMASVRVKIEPGHTAEMELGRVRGYTECLRDMEGLAFKPEAPPDQPEQEFSNDEET